MSLQQYEISTIFLPFEHIWPAVNTALTDLVVSGKQAGHVFQLFSVWLQRQLAGSLLVSAPASDAVVQTCVEEGHLKAQ